MSEYKPSSEPLIEGITPNGHFPDNVEYMKIKCDLDCSKLDYCLMFSSAPVGGIVYFQCPKRACVNWWIEDEKEKVKYPDYSREVTAKS